MSGPIENVNPASNPFFMFFGNTAFIIKITNKFLSKLYLKIGKNAKKKSQSVFQVGSRGNVYCLYEMKTHIRGRFFGLGYVFIQIYSLITSASILSFSVSKVSTICS